MMGFQKTERKPTSCFFVEPNHFNSYMKAKSYKMLLLPVAQLHRYFFGQEYYLNVHIQIFFISWLENFTLRFIEMCLLVSQIKKKKNI